MNANGDKKNLRLAIYGKGGIGKSTIAANLSAAFAAMGKSVLQIGCDPKHDSTRLLLGGQTIETVLEHLENPMNQADMMRFRRNLMSPDKTVAEVVAAGRGLPEGLERQNVLHEGFGGVLCIEAGGPRPGVGCAGRGIITTFELLQKLHVNPADFDVVLYDVLGDVVCGGFGVPMRREHANAILLVTSEEYMPIFAANNILRGVKTYDRQERRLTGLFLNRRDNKSPRSLVDRFADVAELSVVAELPRSAIIQKADHLGQTLAEAFSDSNEAAVFRHLAEALLDESSPRYCAKPVTDEDLEFIVLGRNVSPLPLGEGLGVRAVGNIEDTQSIVADGPHPNPLPKGEGTRHRATKGEPRRLAIYGKGGIGKSTIAANISATLASCGMRVLQIGCDPKHDSTRLLLGGRSVKTVLEYLRDVAEADRRLDEVVHEGILGVDCVEVGGPEPGIGCAGRGILSAFTLLEKLGLREHDYDVIVYDVLGDVVCGGFAIPLRKGYAQSVVLVTSEEYMPLYAANNILRGINGVAGIAPRVLGIFHNVRDNDADLSATERFSQAVGLPIISRLERSTLVQDAEQLSRPLVLFAPQSQESGVSDRLVQQLLDDSPHYSAMPLESWASSTTSATTMPIFQPPSDSHRPSDCRSSLGSNEARWFKTPSNSLAPWYSSRHNRRSPGCLTAWSNNYLMIRPIIRRCRWTIRNSTRSFWAAPSANSLPTKQPQPGNPTEIAISTARPRSLKRPLISTSVILSKRRKSHISTARSQFVSRSGAVRSSRPCGRRFGCATPWSSLTRRAVVYTCVDQASAPVRART